jgi:HAMP domain-containing protein
MPYGRRVYHVWLAMFVVGLVVLVAAFRLNDRQSSLRDARQQAQIDRADAERRVIQEQNARSVADRAAIHDDLEAVKLLNSHFREDVHRKLDAIMRKLGIDPDGPKPEADQP